MTDYIFREAALAECDWYANEFSECEYAIMPLKGALEILPAADVREVVLCGDCEFYGCRMDALREVGFCKRTDAITGAFDFCSRGKKKEE